jgi:hypothetical protein
VTSNTDTFVIPVNVDSRRAFSEPIPMCHAQRILLSSGTDLGGTYQSRTFRS